VDKWDIERKEREEAETRRKYAIARQAAIDSMRAIAAKALNRYEQVENGLDPDTDTEITTSAEVDRIQAEIASELHNLDILLIHRIGAEIAWDPDTMARTDGNASNDRLVVVPAAYWSNGPYGSIVLIPAQTYAW
jgi:hypothetical protein